MIQSKRKKGKIMKKIIFVMLSLQISLSMLYADERVPVSEKHEQPTITSSQNPTIQVSFAVGNTQDAHAQNTTTTTTQQVNGKQIEHVVVVRHEGEPFLKTIA